MWNHGSDYYQGFSWTALDEILCAPGEFSSFRKFSITVRDPTHAGRFLPQLCHRGKLVLDETDSDHGCVCFSRGGGRGAPVAGVRALTFKLCSMLGRDIGSGETGAHGVRYRCPWAGLLLDPDLEQYLNIATHWTCIYLIERKL